MMWNSLEIENYYVKENVPGTKRNLTFLSELLQKHNYFSFENFHFRCSLYILVNSTNFLKDFDKYSFKNNVQESLVI